MKVNSVNQNLYINSTHNSNPFIQNKQSSHTMSEKQYNQIVAMSGLGVLGILGVALAWNLYPRKAHKKAIIKNINTAVNLQDVSYPVYRGPNIRLNSNQPTISSAWNKYIYSVEDRIKTNKKNYIQIFKDNEKQLDKYEKFAEQNSIKRIKKTG